MSVVSASVLYFIGAAALVFLFAFVVEIAAICRYQQAEYKVTKAAIYYLKKKKQNGRVVLRREEISDKLREPIWNWFKQHLAVTVVSPNEYEPQLLDDRFVLLQYPSVLSRSVPRSGLQFIPALLTAIGLLGTFYGIQTGLSKFDLSAIADGKKLLEASTQVLSGMKTAFTTSLVGLGCASAFMLVLAGSSWARNFYRERLLDELHKIVVLSRTENTEQRAALALERAAMTMKGLTPQAIGQEVGAALTPVFKQIHQELKTLREIKADQGQEILQKLIQELRTDVLQPMTERLDRSAKLTQEASQAVMNLQAELGGVSKSLAASILTIQQFQKETIGRLEEFAGGLSKTLSQFQTETQVVLREVAQEIKQGVDQSITGMEAQRTAFAESAENAAATFRDIRLDLQAALHTQAEQEQQMLQALELRMTSILKDAHIAFQTQTNTLQAVGNEASNLMHHARENLVGSLQNIDGMLQSTRQTVQEELEHFRIGYQASLQDFFTQQNNLLESTLGQQRQGLAQVVEELQTTFQQEVNRRQQLTQEVEQSLIKIQETVQVVSNLANTIGLNSGARMAQIQELSHSMGQQVLDLKSAYQNLANQFNQSLQQGNEQLAAYLHRSVESEKQFFVDADKATAKLCNSLLQAANYLVAAEDNRQQERGGSLS